MRSRGELLNETYDQRTHLIQISHYADWKRVRCVFEKLTVSRIGVFA